MAKNKERKNDNVLDKALFQIDKFQLDREWSEQTDLMFDFAVSLLPEAEKEYEELEADKEALHSELDEKIRLRPHKFGFDKGTKPTEVAIKSCIARNPDYQDLTRRAIHAKATMRAYQGAVKTLEHRKAALEHLTHLDGRAYFARPKKIN